MEKTKTIPIGEDVYKLLEEVATKRKTTPNELANQLLDKEINRKFYKFFNGTKWYIPKNTFIVSALPHEQWSKLRKWLDKGDFVSINTMSGSEVLFLNDTKLDKHRAKKAKN